MKPEGKFKQWISDNHPEYIDYSERSYHNHFYLSDSITESAIKINEILTSSNSCEIDPEDLRFFINKVIPPNGFIFITLENEFERVGINVPRSVFKS